MREKSDHFMSPEIIKKNVKFPVEQFFEQNIKLTIYEMIKNYDTHFY